MLLFFFYTNKEFRDMYTCSVNMFTVRMNVCMYLRVVAFRKKISIHFIFSFTPLAITPLALLIKTSNPFYPLNDILK